MNWAANFSGRACSATLTLISARFESFQNFSNYFHTVVLQTYIYMAWNIRSYIHHRSSVDRSSNQILNRFKHAYPSIRLSSCVSVLPTAFEFYKDIKRSYARLVTENGPNSSKDMPTIKHGLRTLIINYRECNGNTHIIRQQTTLSSIEILFFYFLYWN